MENFDWTKISRKIAVKAELSDLYNAWTKAEDICKWFLRDARFYDSEGNKIDDGKNFQKGYSYEWEWYIYPITEKGRLIEANGRDHIQFSFAGDCTVDIKLIREDGYVAVELTQSNIPTDEKSKKEIRLGCDTGWSFYLVNLKSIYEGGIDLRNKDTKVKAMVNM